MDKEFSSLRQQIYSYAQKKYNTKIEYLWFKYPNYGVLRNNTSNKWYAINKNEIVDVLNIKVEDEMLKDFLLHQNGIFRGYHMSKNNWISVLLDGTVNIQNIYNLLDQSYSLTTKVKKIKKEINKKA